MPTVSGFISVLLEGELEGRATCREHRAPRRLKRTTDTRSEGMYPGVSESPVRNELCPHNELPTESRSKSPSPPLRSEREGPTPVRCAGECASAARGHKDLLFSVRAVSPDHDCARPAERSSSLETALAVRGCTKGRAAEPRKRGLPRWSETTSRYFRMVAKR